MTQSSMPGGVTDITANDRAGHLFVHPQQIPEPIPHRVVHPTRLAEGVWRTQGIDLAILVSRKRIVGKHLTGETPPISSDHHFLRQMLQKCLIRDLVHALAGADLLSMPYTVVPRVHL